MSTITDNLSTIQLEIQKFDPQEARARCMFPVTKFESFSHSDLRLPVYEVDEKTASIFDPTDFSLPAKFVTPAKKQIDHPVLTVACAVKYSRLERLAAANCHSWDLQRIVAAKKAIYLQEERIAFLGESKSGKKNIKGLLDTDFWGTTSSKEKGKVEEVAAVNGKKKWSEKTPDDILIDIEKAIIQAAKDGVYSHPKVLVVPYDQFLILHRPIGNERYVSLATFLANELNVEIYYSQHLKAANHGATHNSINTSTDLFICFPKSSEVLSLCIVQDVQSSQESYDGLENLQLSIWEKMSGVVLSKPGALYLGRGI